MINKLIGWTLYIKDIIAGKFTFGSALWVFAIIIGVILGAKFILDLIIGKDSKYR